MSLVRTLSLVITVCLAGAVLSATTPAEAKGRSWTTVVGLKGAKAQACKDVFADDGAFEVLFRVNARKADRPTKGIGKSIIDGFPLKPFATTTYVRPGAVSKAIGYGGFTADNPSDFHAVLRWKSGKHRNGTVALSDIAVC